MRAAPIERAALDLLSWDLPPLRCDMLGRCGCRPWESQNISVPRRVFFGWLVLFSCLCSVHDGAGCRRQIKVAERRRLVEFCLPFAAHA